MTDPPHCQFGRQKYLLERKHEARVVKIVAVLLLMAFLLLPFTAFAECLD